MNDTNESNQHEWKIYAMKTRFPQRPITIVEYNAACLNHLVRSFVRHACPHLALPDYDILGNNSRITRSTSELHTSTIRGVPRGPVGSTLRICIRERNRVSRSTRSYRGFFLDPAARYQAVHGSAKNRGQGLLVLGGTCNRFC
jgi:hypothetical protein